MNYHKFQKQFPFLSQITLGDREIICVIDIQTKTKTAMYFIDIIESKDVLAEFMSLCNQWWWQSNRNVPISLFIQEEMSKFKKYRRVHLNKDITVNEGHVVLLTQLQKKRIKRKHIKLQK